MIMAGLFVFAAAFISSLVLTYQGLVSTIPPELPGVIRQGVEWVVASGASLNSALPIGEMWTALGVYVKLLVPVFIFRLILWVYHNIPVLGASD